ncbi:plastocyanin/azurin family copper-binding protein [Conexibacter sp. JD483]|uniref:plastocyanin/azurin family copper-binding protein n=1 Tax=unclassified Conexibacter TaxID=2627773 RepID=UPI00271D75D9|nr:MULTISPECIES: plastocyanin/azurin family copper-binding protein [unclassified Conexibacter]MDO8186300.1 plastocyanin/azurin family copper-binding protein [Conexibacter sp. CPCC 205706]MDO8197505.1 plastocyanin/azurin family copper-binding protein [Conexibacter sp. CPCC 205762]MDR9370288.1 plastocyanin/azurin family copper-binding protein [Conexibacter sp. JD483]
MTTRGITGLAALLAAALAVALAAPAAQAATRTVTLKNIAFNPKKVTIGKGDRVVWRWRDSGIIHNVTSSRFRGSGNRSGGSYGVTFRSAGTYSYRCTLHPGMNGTVVVRR